MSLIRTLLLLTVLLAPLRADEVWSWHTFDYQFLHGERWQALMHGRVHVDEGDFRQGRIGPVFRYNLPPRLTLIAGYYFGEDYNPLGEWKRSHRPFGGIEAAVATKKYARLTARTMLERFLVPGSGDYWRQRNRVRWTTAQRIAPVASWELFFDNKGYLTTRYTGGVRFTLSHKRALELGYLYDGRRANTGEPRHIVTTHFVFGGR